jgi:membrane-bound metal-dependent hydrolase YbcI (DUF457 family)
MSPVGHTAVGLLGWQWFSEKKNLKTLAFFIIIANLPDIDFTLFLFLGKKGLEMHQYFTHNVFFVGLTALLLWPWLKKKRERFGIVIAAFSHLLLDFLTIDAKAPFGFRLFYPFSDQLFNFGILPNLWKENLSDVFSLHNVRVICFEIAFFLVPVLLVYKKTFNGYLNRNESRKQ